MKRILLGFVVAAALVGRAGPGRRRRPAPPLGLPPVPIPADNPQTPEKIALGKKLFEDKRFSSTGQVACATCHDAKKAFTDSPLADLGGHQEGGKPLTGTRNAPTVVNAAYFVEPVLGRPLAEPRGPVAAPLPQPRGDGPQGPPADPEDRPDRPGVRRRPSSRSSARRAAAITMNEVTQAIAAFERTQVVGRLALRPLLLQGRRQGAQRASRSAASTSSSTRGAASPAT